MDNFESTYNYEGFKDAIGVQDDQKARKFYNDFKETTKRLNVDLDEAFEYWMRRQKVLSEKDVKIALSIDEQRLKGIVERAGGQWGGVNTCPSELHPPRENFIEFLHPLTHSNISLPISKVTEDNVKKKLIEHAKIWGIKAIRTSSFIGNEVVPELDFLDTQKHIDLNDQSLVVKELINMGRKDVAEYVRTIIPGSYALLVQHVKTSNKVENVKGTLKSCPYCGKSITEEGCPNHGWGAMTEEELEEMSKEESNILSEKDAEIPSREEIEELIDREQAMEEEQKKKSPKERDVCAGTIAVKKDTKVVIVDNSDLNSDWIKKVKK